MPPSDRNGPLPDSKRAVSPLTGVVLKVAIAVLLAAVTITVTLTLLPDTDPAPQVTVGVEQDPEGQTVTFTHLGGDSLEPGAIAFEGPGVVNPATLQSEVEAGDTIRIQNVVADPGDTVRFVWLRGGQSAVLKELNWTQCWIPSRLSAANSVSRDIRPDTLQLPVLSTDRPRETLLPVNDTVGYNFVSDSVTTGRRNCSRDYSR